MTTSETGVATVNKDANLALNEKGELQLKTLDDMHRFAEWVKASGIGPKGAGVSQILVQMQIGGELGLSRMQSLSNIAVINGRATVEGKAMMALLTQQEVFDPTYPYDMGDRMQPSGEHHDGHAPIMELVGWVKTMKLGWLEPRETVFTWSHAVQAKLNKKAGPWQEYPQNMLMWRAVSNHVNRYYPEFITGLMLKEVALDMTEGLRVEGARVVNLETVGDSAPDPLLAGAVEAEIVDGPAEGGETYAESAREFAPAPPEPSETPEDGPEGPSLVPMGGEEPDGEDCEAMKPCLEMVGCIFITGHDGACDNGTD